MPTSKNGLRILPWLGWGSVVLALLIATIIVWSNHEQRRLLADQAHERGFRRMLATKDRVEAHLHNIWLCAQLISLDPHIANMTPGPYEQLRAVYKATSEKHRLTEIYVAERDFDGSRRPFLTLIKKARGELVESKRSLAREAEEYTIIREHIRRFLDEPPVEFLVSRVVRLCVGRPGVACSVPVRSEGRLTGIVSGMVPVRDISRILEFNSAGNEVLLAKEDGSLFPCHHVRPETRSWFDAQLGRKGVVGFFGKGDRAFRIGDREALCTKLDIPGNEKWYLAYVCDKSGHTQLSGLQGVLIGWGSAGVVLVLGAAVMILCRVTPALVAARARADKHARQLAESEARYRSLVENINLGVTLVDADHNIVMTNEAQARMFNKPACAFVGKKCFAEFEKRDAVCPYCPGTRAMETGTPAEIETEGVRDDGTRFVAHIRAFPTTASNGRPTGFIEVVEDITERRQAEEQSRARQAELAHVARLGTMGEIATGLAHELNQPLCAIVNHVQACLERIQAGQTASEELLDDMTYSAEQAIRAGEIIERLRHFVGSPRRQQTTVHVNALVHEVADLMRPELRQRGVELHLDLHKALPPLEADAIQVQQVMVNLIKNGIEAMADQTAGVRRITVRTALNAEGLIECAVQDTGPGLCAGGTERVFEAFFSTKANGMGMGLPISRRIIESHGGRLWATANRDRGATFRFTLPIVCGRPAA